ncbi:MAG TPA: hypothetical protein VFE50_10370 [Cyclobacteriaceae bacterium]|nr:hypothetical protein [Cyclobacteriaceae bacterium]
MDINNLAPGIYKLKKSGDSTFRLLRVVDKGKAQKYYFGASVKGLHPSKVSNLGDFEVSEKYSGKPAVSDCKVTLSFKDGSGSTFDIPVETVAEVPKIFVALPWLKKFYSK